jgi:hypothetical protein
MLVERSDQNTKAPSLKLVYDERSISRLTNASSLTRCNSALKGCERHDWASADIF